MMANSSLFSNYLSVAYSQVGDIEKSEACVLEAYRRHPTYLPLEQFPEWQHEAIRVAKGFLESADYLPLPTKFAIHEYRIMERFCYSVDDDEMRDSLCNAIRGRGAFRYFKDRIHEYGIADDWYQYREDALREIAIGWCEENGVPYRE